MHKIKILQGITAGHLMLVAQSLANLPSTSNSSVVVETSSLVVSVIGYLNASIASMYAKLRPNFGYHGGLFHLTTRVFLFELNPYTEV